MVAIERINPGTKEWDAYYADHIIRYQFASGKLNTISRVNLLDAACGVGYGSEYLSKLAGSQITGIDISDEALNVATSQFKKDNIRYIKDDCQALENASKHGPFHAIVSFETLEHLPDPVKFLKNCRANLVDSGMIIISTPNQLVSSPAGSDWEFHEKEYTATEFYTLLKDAGFSNIQLYGEQYNLKGRIKRELLADLNSLWSNPVVRFGRWIQKMFRGHAVKSKLFDKVDDLEIVPYTPEECDRLLINGPFVLVAVANK